MACLDNSKQRYTNTEIGHFEERTKTHQVYSVIIKGYNWNTSYLQIYPGNTQEHSFYHLANNTDSIYVYIVHADDLKATLVAAQWVRDAYIYFRPISNRTIKSIHVLFAPSQQVADEIALKIKD